MRSKRFLCILTAAALSLSLFAGCDLTADDAFVNPGDYLGGGGEVSTAPSGSDSEKSDEAATTVPQTDGSEENVPAGAVQITGKTTISEAGDYYVSGEVSGKIAVECEGVTLYLSSATLTNEKKVIESSGALTITLLGENSLSNTNAEGSNAIDCAGALTIDGTGSLSVYATKNAIKANSIAVYGATLSIESEKDGLHAEVDAYDEATEAPSPAYSDGGYVYLDGADLSIVSADDGIQADTFVYVTGESTVDILAGGGAPATITEVSSDSASGKGIKAGAIDWGADGTDLDWDGYLVTVKSGTVTIDSKDDALHSNGEMLVTGGTLDLISGDDAMHADDLLQITGGTITIRNCYEGIESAKVEISGGTIAVCSSEDGINAADGSAAIAGVANANCHIIISGGAISVNCIGSEGDGIDSNGSILISGGAVYVAGSSNSADAALDADGGILVDGGYLFAAGSLGMVETPASNSAQYCVSFARNTSIAANTTLYLCDGEGETLMYFTAPRSCQSLILSCPELTSGESYSIYGGDSLLATFTVSATITTIGSSSAITNPGGAPGGNRPGANVPGFGGR